MSMAQTGQLSCYFLAYLNKGETTTIISTTIAIATSNKNNSQKSFIFDDEVLNEKCSSLKIKKKQKIKQTGCCHVGTN